MAENAVEKPAPKSVFVREATGLLKEASFFDIFQFNAVSVTGVSIISGSALLLPLMTYGIGIGEAITVGFLLALFVNMVYYILSVTIPRSGGDYVYISRLLHPSLGVLSAGLTGIFGSLVLASTFGATVWVSAGVSPLLSIAGMGGLASAVTDPTSLTIAGIFSTIFFGALLIFGRNKAFYRLNNLLYAVAIIGLLVGLGALLSVGHSGFVKLFDSFASTYSTNSTNLANLANSNGYVQPSSGTWSMLVGSGLLFTSFYWATQSAYVGGEIRNTKRNHFLGMIGAALVWFAITLVVIVTLYNVVGPTLISQASYLDYFKSSLWSLPSISFFALYANIAANNIYVAGLISLAFIFGYITVTGWSFIVFSRAVFALSFDRILPSKLSDISDRFHSPVNAYIAFGILATIFLLLLSIPSAAVTIYTYGVGLNVVYMISFILASLSLVVLPFRDKALFESSSPIKARVGGLPVVSLIGAISIPLLLFYEYVLLSNPVFFGITNSFLEVMVATIIFFLAFYFVAKAIRKRQGIDVTLAYNQIPPE